MRKILSNEKIKRKNSFIFYNEENKVRKHSVQSLWKLVIDVFDKAINNLKDKNKRKSGSLNCKQRKEKR